MDLHAVPDDRDACARRLLPRVVEAGGLEGDVVGLPLPGLLRHVLVGRLLGVDRRSAVLERRIVAEGIENLDLVPALDVDAAVRSRLSLRALRRLGKVELAVEL